MRVEQFGGLALADHNLDTGMTEQFFKLVQPRPVVEIAHHDQRLAGGQVLIDPLPQPDTFSQRFAAVVDGNAGRFRGVTGPMRGFGFRMHPDQTQGLAGGRLGPQFQWRL